MKHRLLPLDWLRGIVMILMVTDHASSVYNAGHLFTDSTFFYNDRMALPAGQFLNRWISHLCAPSFLFLAGTALALSIVRKQQHGFSSWQIDRDLLIRGSLIVAVDLLFINLFWMPGRLLLQVMAVIGGALLLMIPLRRLPVWLTVMLAAAVLLGSELFLPDSLLIAEGNLSVLLRYLLSIGSTDAIFVLYPLLPWWGMLGLGWGFGHYLTLAEKEPTEGAESVLLISGFISLILYLIVRGVNGYGNMALLRMDNSWEQWLHTSKYPPSISFVALELGLMALLLAGLFRWQRLRGDRVKGHHPLLVFGQTPLLFYILHIFLLETSGRLLGLYEGGGLGLSWLATAVVLIILYPICHWYRAYKLAHRHSWLRFL